MSPKHDLNKILDEVLKNKLVRQRTEELKMTHDELLSALPILITMNDESKNVSLPYRVSLERNALNAIVAVKVLNEKAQAQNFLTNVITSKYYPIDFDSKNKLNEKQNGQKQLAKNFAPFIRGTVMPKKGFYIYGKQGVGKTFLLKKFVQLLAEKGHKVAFMPVHELVAVLRTSNFDLKAPLINDLKSADLLFLDDIGSETIYYWLRDEILFLVLAYRLEKGKPTFFSSIYNYDVLEKVESKTTGEKFLDKTQAARLVTIIKNLTDPFELK